jgi:heme/copper-type cytochrome/quinol oxidase subunit 1
VGAILGAERIDSGLAILDDGTFGQVYSLHGEVAVFGFLVPFFVGLATYVVPLQVGAREIAFPRGAALGYWGYLVSALLLLAAYAADGGPEGGSDVGIDLHLLALIGLNVALVVGLIAVLTTALAGRAPGMTLLRTPLFTWSIVVGGGLTLLAAPVLVARLIEGYIGHHFGGLDAAVAGAGWFWSVPQVYVLAVPAAGVAAEVIPVLSRSRHRVHAAAMVIIALLGVLGYGAWAQLPERNDELLYVGMALAALLPALALLALLGDTIRRGAFSAGAANLLAIGAVLHLLLAALAGAAAAIDPLELQGTVWQAAQLHLTLYGAATLGAFAALWYWAPKIWGVLLGEAQGKAVFALTFLGALLLAAPDLVSGLVEDQQLRATTFDDGGLTTALNVASLLGGVLGILGVLVVVGELLGKVGRRTGTPASDDPWGGATLEWATSSPPPAGNFAANVPVVASATPLHDARTGSEVDA